LTPPSAASAAPKRARPVLPARISPRDLADYRVCPRRLWYRRIAQVPVPDPRDASLIVGNAVHSALFRFFGLPPGDREPVEERVHQCLRSVWRRHCPTGFFPTRDHERECGEKGLALLSSFATCFSTDVVPLVRERWVEVRLANGVVLFGKADRVDGVETPHGERALEVADYKTSRFMLDDGEVGDEPAAQVYLLAAEAMFRREVRRVRFLYLAHGVEARWEPEREDVDAARDRLLELTSRMLRDRTFEPQPGEHCGRCPFAHLCPDAGRVALSDLEVTDDITF
jgi:CRISPR/Cas system-associated exonuclease Cas4 (RecB family)